MIDSDVIATYVAAISTRRTSTNPRIRFEFDVCYVKAGGGDAVDVVNRHAGRVVSRAELGEHVYDEGLDPDSNALDVLVGRIRRKIGPDRVRTVRGQGFRLDAPS